MMTTKYIGEKVDFTPTFIFWAFFYRGSVREEMDPKYHVTVERVDGNGCCVLAMRP